MRKKLRKPPTDRAVTLLIGKMENWYNSGENLEDILDRSTQNSWIDLYPSSERFRQKTNEKEAERERRIADWQSGVMLEGV